MIFKLTDNFGVKLKTPIFVGCVKYINPFVLDTGSNTVYTSVLERNLIGLLGEAW